MNDDRFIPALLPIDAELYENTWVMLNDAFDADEAAAEALALDFS